MGSNPRVRLPPELVDRSKAWAERMVANYAAGNNERSRSVTILDADTNPVLQAHAKMSECAFAIWAGLDPMTAVHWGEQSDNGYDVFWREKRWDVKATSAWGRYLIWPRGKNHIFYKKKFDLLVLVCGNIPVFDMRGFVSKDEFWKKKIVAPENHDLIVNTWHMERKSLWSMGLLIDGDSEDSGSTIEGAFDPNVPDRVNLVP